VSPGRFNDIEILALSGNAVHLPAAGGFEALAIQENELFGRSLTLGIFDLHAGLILPSNWPKVTRKSKA